MNCPNGDAQLHKHTKTDHDGLSITYFRCPTCGGYWLDPFNANFIKKNHIRKTPRSSDVHSSDTPHCPSCQKELTLTRGDNIPPGVSAWGCPQKHGYYFTDEELLKFKEAQEAKISYHKLWAVPLPSLASVLLVGIGTFLLTGSIVATFRQAQERQSIQSRAGEILVSQQAIINADDGSVTFLVSTGAPSSVFVTIKNSEVRDVPLTTTDTMTHAAQIQSLKPGQYTYVFTITTQSATVTSEEYTLILIP